MKLMEFYYAVKDGFFWVLPHPISWILGLAFGVVVFAYLVVRMNLKRTDGRISHRTHFLVVVVSIIFYIAFHSLFIHSSEGRDVLGGFLYQTPVEAFILSSGNVTEVEIISSFVAWSDPERVWTRGSLMTNRVVAAMLIGLVLGSVLAFIERVPRVREFLLKLAQR